MAQCEAGLDSSKGIKPKISRFSLTPNLELSLLQWFSRLVPFFEKWKSSCSSLLFLWPAVFDYPHTAKNYHDNKPVGLVVTLKIMFLAPLKWIYQQGAMESLHLSLDLCGNFQGTNGEYRQNTPAPRKCHMIKTLPETREKVQLSHRQISSLPLETNNTLSVTTIL